MRLLVCTVGEVSAEEGGNMKKEWKKRICAGVMCAALTSAIFPVQEEKVIRAEAMQPGSFDADSLTIQPGETTSSLNLNWYAPAGTTKALVKFGALQKEASVSELHQPTELKESKYTDTGKLACKVTVSGLMPDTEYTYQISNDDGATWSEQWYEPESWKLHSGDSR